KIEARPGFDSGYQLVYKNRGTTVLDGSISFQFDNKLQSFISSTSSYASKNTNTVFYNFINLKPYETRKIDIVMNTLAPPTVNDGDLASFQANITIGETDVTPSDNMFLLNQVVVNSFDPNDKAVIEGISININEVNKYLHYIVRFQNTGSASAINVRIKDILSNYLDWETLTPVSASHEYFAKVTNGNIVEFIFNEINLPAQKDDDIGSNGFISFKIKPKKNIEIGDVISGKANIYFDFNLPITTNVVNTEIIDVSISDDDKDGITNDKDLCNNTSVGESVNENGCSQSQLDDDKDGISNDRDLCNNTLIGETVNENGCSQSQLDDDKDGINNDKDLCNNTSVGESVNANGCSESQLDTDNDGINNDKDLCDNTSIGETVNENGCSQSQLDDDKDGVSNDKDLCDNTPTGESVKGNGCSQSQLDENFNFKEVILYPNPTMDKISVSIPETTVNEVLIRLYDLKRQLIFTKSGSIVNNKIEVSLKEISSGMYLIKIELEKPITLKIIKN
ncbi:T9SS type A sorting domain-containing protein, partial [Tenacibaculum sp.]|nr:T9SS type A sorting domain-containing protein [Tenacibaculum sp.]